MKKHSTGALTAEQKQQQDQRYSEGHEYDYLIIGSGNSAITVAALLTNAGKKVCLLEAHDRPGGYAHSFEWGDYHFCAHIHYIWGCGEGSVIYEFLRKLGLEKDITFELYDPDGYDHMVTPDGKVTKFPYGFEQLKESISTNYPDQKENLEKFFALITRIRKEFRQLPEKLNWWSLLTQFYKFRSLIKYRKATLQDLFDKCHLSIEVQTVLAGNAGDIGEPPERISAFIYIGLLAGYGTGAYYPTKHFKYYTERLAQFITDHEGCHIYYETEVSKINHSDKKIESVETKDGKTFTAKHYICNMDPQKAATMMGVESFPSEDREKLSYTYSPSSFVVYLGLKDIDLREYGFGSHNTWRMEQWDMNKIWQDLLDDKYDKPWIFITTPSLHGEADLVTPPGGQIMEITTMANYNTFKELLDQDKHAYMKKKRELTDLLIDMVEKHYVPDLRKHIAVQVAGSPTTNEDFVMAPMGNVYGSTLTPKQTTFKRLKFTTPWENFSWCNASSGWPSICGTVGNGVKLYMQLTGDKFYDWSKAPSDEQLIAKIHQKGALFSSRAKSRDPFPSK